MIKISVGDRGTLEKFKENKGKYRYALVGVEDTRGEIRYCDRSFFWKASEYLILLSAIVFIMNMNQGMYLVGLMILVTICSVSFCVSADESVASSSDDSPWAGTWIDTNYTVTLSQNGSTITGIAVVSDPEKADPFKLTGTLSDDGKTLQSVLTETGTLILNLSEDKMMFYGAGTVDAVDNVSEPLSYTFNATRNGTTIIPDQEWTGTWESKKNIMTFIQNGTSVTGDYHALTSLKFGGQVNGTISADGQNLSMIWISPEDDTFTLSVDGMNLIEGECTDEKISVNGYCLNLTKKV